MNWTVIPRDDSLPSMTITVRIIVLVLAIPTTFVCGLRLYLRKFVLNSWGLDDWMVMIALVSLPKCSSSGRRITEPQQVMVNGFSTLAFTITYYGLGKKTKDVPDADLLVWWKIYYAALCSYLLVAASVKTSLTVFIMRLFPTHSISIAGKSILGFLAVFTLAGTLALAFQCRPVRAGFDKTIPDAKCYSVNTSFAILMAQGVIMFVMDLAILALPLRRVWQLQMPRGRRFDEDIQLAYRYSPIKDTAATSLIWMELEFNLGLISGSLSSLRKLFQIRSPFKSRRTSSFTGSRSTNVELGSYKGWGGGISKQTEINRAFEILDSSQEHIAPIYGQGELCTTTNAFSNGKLSR
ncbi:hypothetical protein ASPNIDRAFT_35665 [Aspergillus niger ATCC 1015]|uniref:Rhodopsin domain-containing protein n=1 Tax=Aspergillus niger (strain ATCC 1015 / CBS 113.46 / FGSC A1144 / LSHB Ac4 / NCTC 3858a / NRRL 328 / USDA 3528.7) TaxID=380704 RepID=G3XQV6_ASPNA|nr:hypothetical protein ASPNIDRAFT_35665 [Aspergillus niger ATCC 1015]